MADTTIDLLKNSSYVGKMDELIAAVKLGSGATSDVEWDNVKNKPTTIGGYGITDAKIDNGTITLGDNSITPLTSSPVTSVNSKTGDVVLGASDVGAISTDNISQTLGTSTIKVPSEKAVSDALSTAGAGDMLKSVYDPNGSVATAGGIPDYVANNAPVTSVNNKTGAVTLTKGDVGLSQVDNVRQYSAQNPPPYPVTSGNGKTGGITVREVPSVTTSDNGKFLRVVNGAWAAVEIANANGVRF